MGFPEQSATEPVADLSAGARYDCEVMGSLGQHTPEATPEERFLRAHRALRLAKLHPTPRPSLLRRAFARRDLAPPQSRLSGAREQELEKLAASAARSIMLSAFRSERQSQTVRHHAFHPEVLGDDDVLRSAITSALHTDMPDSERRSIRQPKTWGEYPEIEDLITVDSLRRLVHERVARFQGISQSPRFNISCRCSEQERCACASFVVEHHASGLRAKCFRRTDDGTWGIIPKPWDVASPSGNPEDGQHYVGLGIGRWLYTVAASRRPLARWRADAVIQPTALAIRGALHLEDPFTWDSGAGECDWCRARKLEWLDAIPADFSTHPVLAPRHFPRPRLHFGERQRTE